MDFITSLDQLRIYRDLKVFSIINRGKLWYDSLSAEQLTELAEWYKDWLNITKTKIIPDIPEFLKGEVEPFRG